MNIICGLILMISAIWVGAWSINCYGEKSWQYNPIWMTAGIAFAIGLLLIIPTDEV